MTLNSLIINIKWRLSKIFLSKRQQAWKTAKRQNSSLKKGDIIPLNEYSPNAPITCHEKKRAICIYDDKFRNGGLADRLRGIISIYKVCKELDIDLKIVFNHPFNLTDFLIPNKIKWDIKSDELNYNTSVTDLCFIYTRTDCEYEARKQEKWFKKEFQKKYKEYHIRTNAIFSYWGDFSNLFNELFRLSPQLDASIKRQKEILGTNYISTSFRFLHLLDDFNEADNIGKKLPVDERYALITKNITQLQNLHHRYPERKILVNSDSTTFLQEASKLNYVYIIPGNVTHIGGKNTSNEYQTYEKTFLDFFMIANAERIFLLRTGQMYNSGYPFAASKMYNKPFEKIEF